MLATPHRPRGRRPRAAEQTRRDALPGDALSIDVASRGLATFAISIDPKDVVFVKGVVEASDGLAAIFAEDGGELCVACPPSRANEVRELLADLGIEPASAESGDA
jgi:hypothetical protein